MHHCFHKNIKQHNTDNTKKYVFVHQHIRMISEGSFYIEDWSSKTENSALSSQE